MPIIPITPIESRPSTAPAAAPFFRNYLQFEPRLPMAAWYVARALVFAITLALVLLLIAWPERGLMLFWGVAVPLLPALLVLAPGFWRQVCPMATLNQLPRLGGFSRALELPPALKKAAFGIAVGLFVTAVALRSPWLNHSGPAVGIGIVIVLALALAGGVMFKGRSGWCGTFCPLAPVQRAYGHAPLVVVRNGYCNPCVGCQKSCYDFNPRAAVFSDLYDEDERHAAQRRLFMGLLPGLVLGYFLGPADGTAPVKLLYLLGGCAASAGLYGLAVAFLPASPYRVALLFGTVALAVFYWFAGPLLVHTSASLIGIGAVPLLEAAAHGLGIVLALALTASGLYAEARYKALQRASAAPRAGADLARPTIGPGASLKDRLAPGGAAVITDRQSGISFPVAANASLLEAIEGAGLKIGFGCRAGVCGADPVRVCEGADNLSPPSDDELATLRRLGLEGRARLACVCRVTGPVLIDRDPHSAGAPERPSQILPPAIDKARLAGVKRVVIVGNGVAGMTAAEALRRQSPSVEIHVIGNEAFHFYNRMAIGRLLYSADGLQDLMLAADDWGSAQSVATKRNVVALRIDRAARRLELSNGTALGYDKLILATGARSTLPNADFLSHPNAFVLRTASDALAMRSHVQHHLARRALVVGGGVLGVEAAYALHKLGLEVFLLHKADRLMNAQLDGPGGARLAAYLDTIGIQVITHSSVVKYEGEPNLTSAWLAHGPRVRADLFVACIGIEPNAYLAEQAALALGPGGVQVDAFMRSSDPDIYAIGDVAELKNTPRGLWTIGVAHAATAVAHLLGEPLPYATPRIVMQLKCEGIDVRCQGDVTPRDGDEDFHANADDAAWWRLLVRSGQLVGGVYVGPPGTSKAFTRLLQQPADIGRLRAGLRSGSLEGLADS